MYFGDGVTLVDEYGGAVPVRLDQNIFAYGSTYTVDFMKIPDNDSSDMMSWEYCEVDWVWVEDGQVWCYWN